MNGYASGYNRGKKWLESGLKVVENISFIVTKPIPNPILNLNEPL